jgi:hypothetical protein
MSVIQGDRWFNRLHFVQLNRLQYHSNLLILWGVERYDDHDGSTNCPENAAECSVLLCR